MTDDRTTELLRELRDLACDIHAAEIIDHVHITNRGWTFDSQWLDSWHNEFDRITNELNSRAERTCEMRADGAHCMNGVEFYECRSCGEYACIPTVMGKSEPPNYCPNCGAHVIKSDQDL